MGRNGHAKRGLSIFRAADATDLMTTDFMGMGEMSPETQAGFGQVPLPAVQAGGEAMIVVRQTEEEGGFSLLRVWFKADYPLPRHTHDSDCLYYILSGSLVMGNQTLRAGDAFFVPDGAPYQYNAGPDGVEVLEIRKDVERFDLNMLDDKPERWQEMKETMTANHERWAAMATSPTMEAYGRG